MSGYDLDEWQAYFENFKIEELIAHISNAFPSTIAEVTALYGKFIEIAFIETTESNHVRALSAAWAKAIESVVEVRFSEQQNSFHAFIEYRNHYKAIALEHGYGTAMYRIRHEPNEIFRIFDGETQDAEVTSRSAFLAEIAFGREVDR